MCGIVGYIGRETVSGIILDVLGRLEYRGYDSAGIATIENGRMFMAKDVGKLEDVISKDRLRELPGHLGIGHVRWATHGSVTPQNAHPLCDEKYQVAVVHNGVIENYAYLKERLEKKYHFLSETDTEVIPHLIREKLDTGLDYEMAFLEAVSQLQGSFAIVSVFTLEPDRLFAAKKGSQLVVGMGDEATFIGSDALCFLPYTRKAIFIEDGETVIATRDDIRILDSSHHEIKRDPVQIDTEWSNKGKDGFAHYMLKEIHEQPQTIHQVLLQDEKRIAHMALDILRIRDVIFTACGSSRFAALIGRYAFSKIGRVFSDVVMASEFGYFSESVDKNTLVIAVSQSGETADVLDGVRRAKANGATIHSLVNMTGSSLARLSDGILYLNCGPEIGVAATKSFSAQISLLYLLAYAMAGSLEDGQVKLKEAAEATRAELPGYLSELPPVADRLKGKHDFYYLARGINFAMACEGALKLKEIAYVHAEGMAAGELKHGTLALVEPGTPVIAVCPTDYTYGETIANIEEAKARGAYIVGLSDTDHRIFDEWIKIPKVEEVLYPLVTAIPLQLLAYYSAVCRGLDPDKPRNLAKSVTVK